MIYSIIFHSFFTTICVFMSLFFEQMLKQALHIIYVLSLIPDSHWCSIISVHSHIRIRFIFAKIIQQKIYFIGYFSDDLLQPSVVGSLMAHSETLIFIRYLSNNKDDNIHKQRSSQKSDLYLNQGPRKSRFPLNLTDRYTYIRTDIGI